MSNHNYLETRSFREDEVKEAVWDCDGAKNSGPDGFNFVFYKTCWNILKVDLMQVLHEFHANGRLVKGSNSSFIVLLPKKEGICRVNHLRPISLIRSLYKILARHLKSILGNLIQTAFLKGRNILDGVMILNKVVEDAKKRKKELMVSGVDFEKAYDSIDWDYLWEMLRRKNFPDKWIRKPVWEFHVGKGYPSRRPVVPLYVPCRGGWAKLVDKKGYA